MPDVHGHLRVPFFLKKKTIDKLETRDKHGQGTNFADENKRISHVN
jgi:hypothetical protein